MIIAIALALIVGYYVLRRCVIAIIVAVLVAGYKADPKWSEMVRTLVKERNELEERRDILNLPESGTTEVVGKELAAIVTRLDSIDKSIASFDVSCAYGRDPLVHEAWDIYDSCWRRPRSFLEWPKGQN